jgi:hypothetical protein
MASREHSIGVFEEQAVYSPRPLDDEPIVKPIEKQFLAAPEPAPVAKTLPVVRKEKKKIVQPKPNELDLDNMSRAARNAPGSSVPEHWLVRNIRDTWEVITAASE